MTQHVGTLLQKALGLHRNGRLGEAEGLYRSVLSLDRRNVDALYLLGLASAQAGRLAEAADWLRKAVALEPRHAQAHNDLGNALFALGKPAEAVASYRKAIHIDSANASAHYNLANALAALGRTDEAIGSFRRALKLAPRFPAALTNLGNALQDRGDLREAVACYEEALKLEPAFPEALVGLGNALNRQGRAGEAEARYGEALRLRPDSAEALNGLGLALGARGRHDAAIAAFRRAMRARPDFVDARVNLGNALLERGRTEEAVAELRKAAERDAGSVEIRLALADALRRQGEHADAVASYRDALRLRPADARALVGLARQSRVIACWDDWPDLARRLTAMRFDAAPAPPPFALLSLSESPELQKRAAEAYAAKFAPLAPAARPGRSGPDDRSGLDDRSGPDGRRLRVGYLSADIRRHPIAHLTAEVFELHDRTEFEVFVYSYGPEDGSEIRERIRHACDGFRDMRALGLADMAAGIRGDRIDLLVDITGFTGPSRSEVLALRPAPVQINWLGYAGTMGAEFVDVIIADSFIIPEGAERFYTERVVRLPDAYQPNDRKRRIEEAKPRRDYGLPEHGTVFCCFNQTYKISPETFGTWMAILDAVPGSVLWLLEGHADASRNLRAAAHGHGVEPGRIVFAPRAPLHEHLARYGAADLALDTFPYTSHTTASDALWAGCPLVTRAGESFASRVAGSLLRAAGRPDLVTFSPADYANLAVALARDPDRLGRIRAELRDGRDACRLFDTPRFVANLENAYRGIWRAFRTGTAR